MKRVNKFMFFKNSKPRKINKPEIHIDAVNVNKHHGKVHSCGMKPICSVEKFVQKRPVNQKDMYINEARRTLKDPSGYISYVRSAEFKSDAKKIALESGLSTLHSEIYVLADKLRRLQNEQNDGVL